MPFSLRRSPRNGLRALAVAALTSSGIANGACGAVPAGRTELAAPTVAPSGGVAVPLPETFPCASTGADWGPRPQADALCRDRAQGCSDMNRTYVIPPCDERTLDAVISIGEFRRRRRIYPSETLAREGVAIRGYLRRDGRAEPLSTLMEDPAPPPPCGHDYIWAVRLEGARTYGECDSIPVFGQVPEGSGLGWSKSELCWGDATMACCANAVVDSDVEVVISFLRPWKNGEFCLPIPFPAAQHPRSFLRKEEQSHDGGSPPNPAGAPR